MQIMLMSTCVHGHVLTHTHTHKRTHMLQIIFVFTLQVYVMYIYVYIMSSLVIDLHFMYWCNSIRYLYITDHAVLGCEK